MLFHTATFAVFFAAVWCAHWAVHRVAWARNALIVAASWTFYAAWDPRFLSLLVLSTVVDYVAGRCIEVAKRPRTRRAWLAVSVVTNLGLLGTFKYYDFFATSAARLLESLGLSVQPALLHVVLPVGISFYTFQTLAYSIDVYRGRIAAERSIVRFAALVAFFPQLVAGPIERAERLLPQIAARPIFRWSDQLEGAVLFVVGLCKKVVVADRLGPFVDVMFDRGPSELAAGDVVLAAVAFAFQIWGDFSGYTDMARGTARTLGIRLTENFHGPYFSTSPREFWRRWHVSLSAWLRDYLYIPLGGNRGTRWQVGRALFSTMLLGGLWHGAAWTFVVWGAGHGLWLAAHRWWVARTGGLSARYAPLAMAGTFAATCLGWIVFRAPNLHHAASMLAELGDLGTLPPWANVRYVLHFIWFAVMLQALRRFVPRVLEDREYRPLRLVLATYALLLVLTEGAFGEPRAFIYFQF